MAAARSPRIPIDHGTTQLGLLMQLTGAVMMCLAIVFALFLIFAQQPTPITMGVFLLGGASAIRSAFHWRAGAAFLYQPQQAASACKQYVILSLVHTVCVLLIVKKFFGGAWGASENIAMASLLASWPLFIAYYTGTGACKRDLSFGLELPSDLGFEGTGVLMRYFGGVGVLFSFMLVAVLFLSPGRVLSSPHGWLFLAMLGALVVRSGLHYRAGLSLTRGIDSPDQACETSEKYWSVGIAVSVCVAGGLFIQIVMGGLIDMSGILVTVLLGACLLAWPLQLRRYFSDRTWRAMVAREDEGIEYSRAPDAGLLALGFLFIGQSLPRLAYNLPTMLFPPADAGAGGLLSVGATSGSVFAEWSTLLLAGAAVIAGFSLIRQSPNAKNITMGYSALAILVIGYLEYPVIATLNDGLRGLGTQQMAGQLAVYAGLAIELLLPVTALLLLTRKDDIARAVVRPPTTGGRGQSNA